MVVCFFDYLVVVVVVVLVVVVVVFFVVVVVVEVVVVVVAVVVVVVVVVNALIFKKVVNVVAAYLSRTQSCNRHLMMVMLFFFPQISRKTRKTNEIMIPKLPAKFDQESKIGNEIPQRTQITRRHLVSVPARRCTMVQNSIMSQHLTIHFPTSSGENE